MSIPLPWPLLPDATRPQTLEELAQKSQENFDFLAKAGTARRMIAGAMADTGTIVIGSGFACVHNGLGDYTINFTNPFPITPVVLVSVGQNNINAGMMIHPSRTYSGATFSVAIYNAPGTAGEDAPWNFLAVV